ncbi:MAG TPA: PRC-barrel domain-containing protein [Thermoanaerobaculia bacterium]|nr:PRC-barrel domain-containing protein [Thermoanaerobaculia bacterium]
MAERKHEVAGEPRLRRLDEMPKYRVAEGEPDIRGWDVVSSDQKKIGKVHELVVDTERMKVRYLDIELDSKILGIPEKSHVLVPIGGANLDDDDSRVYVNHLSSSRMAAIPPYDHRPITSDYETTIRGLFTESEEQTDRVERPDFFEDEKERSFWGRRRAGREGKAYMTPVDEALREPGDDEDTVRR